MTEEPSTAEITRIDRADGTVEAVVELPDVHLGRHREIAGDVIFRRVRYRRNDRGTREIEKGEARAVELSDERVDAAVERGDVIRLEVPIPPDLVSTSSYCDGFLEISLDVDGADGESVANCTDAGEPIFFGRPSFTIDPRDTRQAIDGFGASGAWWAQTVGGWEGTREAIADLLFGTEDGIGLSIYRYNATGGEMPEIPNEWRTGETYEIGPGEYDWDRDENGRWMLRAANDRGVETFVLFTKTPPARITKNNKTYADQGVDSNLHPENYEEFARYLADIANHLRREEDIDFDWVSPINEPEWDWDEPSQEGTPYTVPQIIELGSVILDTFEEENVGSELLLPEAGAWRFVYGDGRNYAEQFHQDPTLRENLSVLAAHSYWSSDEERHRAGRAMAAYPDTRIWQTEWCEMEPGRDLGMGFALNLVNTVHSDLTIANASSWQFWLAVSKMDYRDGLLYVDPDTEELMESQALWAYGNYTRYIRPGAVRIGVESNHEITSDRENESGISLSAYLGPDEEEIVIVAINEVDRMAPVELVIESDRSDLTLTPHRTSETESLETLPDVTIESADDGVLEGNITLAPRSVTTFTGALTV